MIIQIIGLPGSGKTELAKALKERINAIHLNADEVRATVNSDLGFTVEDRIEQARRMGAMARLIANQGVAPVIVRKEGSEPKKQSSDTMSVYCMDKKEWRSFRIENVTNIKVIE